MTRPPLAAYLGGTMSAAIPALTYSDVPRVLLVDDDEFIAVSLRHYLMARGCEVISATDRETAGQHLAQESFDVVLVDPYMTGEAARNTDSILLAVRNRQPRARLVIVSAYTSTQLIAAGEMHGAVAVLTKPQSVVFLSQLVMSTLKMQPKETPSR
ncbi:MAG TPA: response regulator [Thermoanaerobaculia bacterium]|nr:response regulator [Thermoanaerobaculia bacterium]